MKKSIILMVNRIKSILKDNFMSFYLYGSLVYKDYRHGWSDIDFICFTKKVIDQTCLDELLLLRQSMLKEYPKNKYFRKFEGIFVSIDGYLSNKSEKNVYWGTSGQRIKENITLDVFAKYELANNSILIWGIDLSEKLFAPSFDELKGGVKNHYYSIREHAVKTDKSLYSCGWLLDISRCLYTLKYKKVISKTKAVEWALKEGLCPVDKELRKTLKIRKNPLKYKQKEEIKTWLATLGEKVQSYADVLQHFLENG